MAIKRLSLYHVAHLVDGPLAPAPVVDTPTIPVTSAGSGSVLSEDFSGYTDSADFRAKMNALIAPYTNNGIVPAKNKNFEIIEDGGRKALRVTGGGGSSFSFAVEFSARNEVNLRLVDHTPYYRSPYPALYDGRRDLLASVQATGSGSGGLNYNQTSALLTNVAGQPTMRLNATVSPTYPWDNGNTVSIALPGVSTWQQFSDIGTNDWRFRSTHPDANTTSIEAWWNGAYLGIATDVDPGVGVATSFIRQGWRTSVAGYSNATLREMFYMGEVYTLRQEVY